MSSIGTGYDLSATTYSPDGRVFQAEYANKAVDNSGTALGIKCKDGVVLAVERIVLSKMLEPDSNRRIMQVDKHVAIASAGLLADGRQIVYRARDETTNHRNTYGGPMPGQLLVDRVSHFVQMHTLYGSVRPFGCSPLIASWDEEGPHLHMIEPNGVSYGYFATAVGKGRQAAKTELEKLKFDKLKVKQAVKDAARIIYAIHDDVKDKDFQLELSWISEESGRVYQPVPKALFEQAEKEAKKAKADNE